MSYSHFVILNTYIVEVVISTTAIVSPKIYIPSSSCKIENFINNIFLFYTFKFQSPLAKAGDLRCFSILRIEKHRGSILVSIHKQQIKQFIEFKRITKWL